MTQAQVARDAMMAYTVAEAAEVLRLSEREVWRMIAEGELAVRRRGRRTLVPRASLEAWLAGENE